MAPKERDPAPGRASQSSKAGELGNCEYNGKHPQGQCLSGTSNSETADDFRNVLARGGKYRVIRCRDDLQYIVQRRVGQSRARPWEARAYVVNAAALSPVLQRPSLGIPDEDRVALIAALALLDDGRAAA